MSRIRYTAEFKAEAVKQITERGHAVLEVAKRLGISDKSLYVWLKLESAAFPGSGSGGCARTQERDQPDESRVEAHDRRA